MLTVVFAVMGVKVCTERSCPSVTLSGRLAFSKFDNNFCPDLFWFNMMYSVFSIFRFVKELSVFLMAADITN